MNDIMGDEQWWRHTSRPTKFFYSEDMRRFYKVNCLSARGRIIGARLAQTTPAMGGSAPSGPAGSSNQASIDQPESPTKSRLHSYSSGRDSIGSAPPLKSAVGGVLAGASGGQAATPALPYNPMLPHPGALWPTSQPGVKLAKGASEWICQMCTRIVTMIEKVKPGEPELQEESPGSGTATRAGTPTVNFKKRLFVQYLWRNAKMGEKSRVQKEFDPRRQRLLQFVTDTAARKRMTGAVGNWRGKTDSEPGSKVTSSSSISQIQYHMGVGSIPIPVFCVQSKPFDVQSTLEKTVRCPVKYLSRAPPMMVVENYCFVVDGDAVDLDDIMQEKSGCQWWKNTATTIRYYSSETLRTFYQVTMLMSKGEMRSAYKTRRKTGGGMDQVPLEKVFRVLRSFSYWKTCKSFHRIVSLVSPVTEKGEQMYGFNKRIFVQYFWRTKKDEDRKKVAFEYAASLDSHTKGQRSSSVSTVGARSWNSSRTSSTRENSPRSSLFRRKRRKSAENVPEAPKFI
uniref:Uncharacterized protein n=1 Tax=Ditylenchus dipsaci TaxID=166011 RepID=A0A915DVU1_9BILA